VQVRDGGKPRLASCGKVGCSFVLSFCDQDLLTNCAAVDPVYLAYLSRLPIIQFVGITARLMGFLIQAAVSSIVVWPSRALSQTRRCCRATDNELFLQSAQSLVVLILAGRRHLAPSKLPSGTDQYGSSFPRCRLS
jgi:hypothetical protein